jgi:predicted Zn-dependent peptidase
MEQEVSVRRLNLAHPLSAGRLRIAVPVLATVALLCAPPAWLAAGGVASAGSTPPPATPTPPFARPAIFDRVEEFRLENGMLFLLLPRPGLPMVSGRIRFRVGNMDSPTGQSGLPHMFEHMAFKGTDRIGTRDITAEMQVQDSVSAVGSALAREVRRRAAGDSVLIKQLREELQRLTDRQIALTVPMEFPRVYDEYTFNYNAWTSRDFTEYLADLPSGELEVWMLMESERIQRLSFREFYRERDVVIEERRQSQDQPAYVAGELGQALAYTAHPYRLPVIGYMSELETLTQEAAEQFHNTYYTPGNAVGVLVGDFDPQVARKMIRDYFGDIPAGPAPSDVGTVEPEQTGLRRGVLRRGTERELTLCFHSFERSDRRSMVAELLADVLSRDITSRLDRRLDTKEKAARSVWADAGVDGRDAGLFAVHATPLEGFTNERVEEMIWEELARVVSEPVTREKLDEIKASRRKRFYRGLATNAALAEGLSTGQALDGDWRRWLERRREIESVTVEEVTDLARTLFTKDHATIIYLEPGEAAQDQTGGGR